MANCDTSQRKFQFLTCGGLLLAGVLPFVGGSRAGAVPLYSVTGLSFPAFPFGTGQGFGINDAGDAVGTAQNASGSHAFIFAGGVMTDLGTLGGADSQAFAVNASDQIAGDSQLNSGLHHPFAYSGTTMTDLTPSASYAGYANGINTAGAEVGTLLSGNGGTTANAFLYSGGTVSSIGTLGGAHSSAFGINDSGQIAGGADTTHGVYHAFVATGGILTDLGTLGGTSSIAYAINSAGELAGAAQAASGDYHAFLYSGGAMHDLGTLGGNASYAYALNNLGMVAGQSQTAAGGSDAMIYFNGAMQDINNLIPIGSGWTIGDAHGINLSGQIVGTGKAPNGSVQAVLLTPVTLTVANNIGVSAPAGLVENPVAFTANSTAGTLTLSGSGSGIAAGVSVAGAGTVNTMDDGGGTNSLTLNGAIVDSQANTLVLQNGSFIPTATNTTTFTAGTLQIGNGSSTGATLAVAASGNLPAATVALTLNNGTIKNVSNAAISVASAINLSGSGGKIDAGAQSVALNGAISGIAGLTAAGGTVILEAAATYTGPTAVTSGNLVFNPGGSVSGTTALTLSPTTSVAMNNPYSNNGITISYTAGNSPNATIRSEIIAGYNGGTWNGASTTGGVINSSVAAGNNTKYAVGYADGADGVATGLGSTQEKVMLTLVGDATLAGRVSLNDFTILLSHFGTASGAQWDQGDFNYDGRVNLQDFTLWLDNYGQSLAVQSLFSSRAAREGVVAPEPSAYTVMGLGLIGLLMFRRNILQKR